MKKTLVAVAVLGAFAGSAAATDVTLYGVIDTGLNFNSTKAESSVEMLGTDSVKEGRTNKFSMASGQSAGSRWGLKGKEDLGNGVKVGFILESGFDSDTGALTKYNEERNRIFGREANLFIESDFGTLSFGRVGALTSGSGSYNLMNYTPFSSGWANTATKSNFWIGDRDRMDNTVTYVTPSLAGLKIYAQYSFERNGSETAGNERQNDRYVALGAAYNNGPFSTALIVDSVLHNYDSKNDKDSLGVTLGASFDFEVVKLFAMGQYGKHETKMGFTSASGANAVNTFFSNKFANRPATGETTPPDDGNGSGSYTYGTKVTGEQGWKGYTLSFGATAPLFGGTALIQANYLDSEACDKIDGEMTKYAKDGTTVGHPVDASLGNLEAKSWGVAVGYIYPFSKRTSVYTFASYSELKLTGGDLSAASEPEVSATAKLKQTEVGFGLVHQF